MTRIVFSIFYRQNVCVVCFFCFGQNWNFSSMMAHWEQDFELRRCFTACHQAFWWNVSVLLWIMRAWGRNVSKLTQCLLIFEFMVGGKNHGEKSCKWPGLGDLATIYRLWVAGLKIEDEKWNNGEKNGRKLANLFLFGGIYNWVSFFKFCNALLANILFEYLVKQNMQNVHNMAQSFTTSLEFGKQFIWRHWCPLPSPPSSTGFVLPGVGRVRSLPNTHFGIFQPHERK